MGTTSVRAAELNSVHLRIERTADDCSGGLRFSKACAGAVCSYFTCFEFKIIQFSIYTLGQTRCGATTATDNNNAAIRWHVHGSKKISYPTFEFTQSESLHF